MSCPTEPAPEWWDTEFHRRQKMLRAQILCAIARGIASRTMLMSICGFYTKLERNYALAMLERDRVIRLVRRELPICHGAKLTKDFTFYELIQPPTTKSSDEAKALAAPAHRRS